MRKKRGEMAVNEIIALVLVVIVIIVILSFLFYKDPILSWMKQLPGYNVNQNDSERDAGIPDIEVPGECYGNPAPQINRPEDGVFRIGKEQYIYINGRNTNLYWYGDEKTAGIYSKSRTLVGDVKDGIVYINEELLNPDYIEYQRDRINGFYGKKPEIDFSISDLIKLNGTKYLRNFLCKTKEQVENEANIGKAWPGNKIKSVSFETSSETRIEGSFLNGIPFIGTLLDKKIKLLTAPLPYAGNEQREKKVYFFKDYNEKIIVMRDASNYPIGVIYSDGSIWFEEVFLFPQDFKNYQSPYANYDSSIISDSIKNGEVILRKDFGVIYRNHEITRFEYDAPTFFVNLPSVNYGNNCKPLSSGREGSYDVGTKVYCESNLRADNFKGILENSPKLKA